MADQGVRYVVTLADINVTSGLRNMEGSALRAEAGVASLNTTLRTLAGALGVGLGVHALVNFGKDAVQGAADYETAIKRIKFASEDFADGAKNINFIIGEADKFKIPLQETTDAYGKFLAMLRGSGIAGDQVRALHDELLLIGKVKGLGQGQLDAAVMNLGKMLESGSLDARHFRPLEQQLSGIGAFVAKELGITVHQLAILRNRGKMTTIDPRVLLAAIGKQAQSLESFLPESTKTIQSQLNDLDNAWLKFKNDLVFDNINELKSLFETLKSGVGYLKDHEQEIITIGKTVITLGKAWLEYKIAIGAVGAIQALSIRYLGEQALVTAKQTGAITAQTGAYAAQAKAIDAVVASINRMNFVQGATNGAFITTAGGITMANTIGNRYSVVQQEAQIAANATRMESALASGAVARSQAINTLQMSMLANQSAANAAKGVSMGAIARNAPGTLAGAGASLGAGMGAAVMPVLITAFAGEALLQLLPENRFNNKSWTLKSSLDASTNGDFTAIGLSVLSALGFDPIQDSFDDIKNLQKTRAGMADLGFYDKDIVPGLPSAGKQMALRSDYIAPGAPGKSTDKTAEKFTAPMDKVTGSHVTNYNIEIKEINGIKQNTVQPGAKVDTEDVATTLRDIIISIVNDSQTRGN